VTTQSSTEPIANQTLERVPADHFGGPVGALALTVVMPVVSFYLWSCVSLHEGSLWLPTSLAELGAMVPAPTWRAAGMLGAWLALHVVLQLVCPGKVVTGALLPNGERLQYKLNGLSSFVVSIALLVGLLATGVLSASSVLAELGALLTLATLGAVALAVWFYVWGRQRGPLERSSGNVVYDFYMGTVLNPRFGLFDLKFFFESHVGMGSWGALAVPVTAFALRATAPIRVAFGRRILPLSDDSSPWMSLNSVVLPVPLRPTKPTLARAGTLALAPSKRVRPAMRKVRSEIVSMGAL